MGGLGRIAVLVPCYNEEKTIEQVVVDFRAALLPPPDAATAALRLANFFTGFSSSNGVTAVRVFDA